MLFFIEIGYQFNGDDRVYYERYVTNASDMQDACKKCIEAFEAKHEDLGVKSIAGDTLDAEFV